MASRVVEYIIGLRDQFSQVAAKVAKEAKAAEQALKGMGNSTNAAENNLGRAASAADRTARSLQGIVNNAGAAQRALHGVSDAAALNAQRMKAAQERQALLANAQQQAAARQAEAARRQSQAAATAAGAAGGAGANGGGVRAGIAAGIAGGLTSAATGLVDKLNPLENQRELDDVLRTIMFKGSLTKEQMQQLRQESGKTAVAIGGDQLKLLDAFESLIQGGLSFDELMSRGGPSGRSLFESIALGAKASREQVGALADNLVALTNQSQIAEHLLKTGQAKSETEAKVMATRMALGAISIAPSLSPDTMAGHSRGLTQILGLMSNSMGPGGDPVKRLYEASALQNLLSLLGYTNAQSGYALKTIMQRLMTPTKAAQDELRAAGINVGRITGVDMEKVLDPSTLMKQLPPSMQKMGPKVGKIIADMVGKEAHLFDIKDAVTEALTKSLPKGTSKDIKEKVRGAVDRHFRGGDKGFDVKAMIEEISKLDVEAMAKVFGLWRAAQGAALKNKDAIKKLNELMQTLEERDPNWEQQAANAKLDPDSYALAIDRLAAAWQNMKNSFADAGFLAIVTNGLESLMNVVTKLNEGLAALGNWRGEGMKELEAMGKTPETSHGFGALDGVANAIRRGIGWEQKPQGENGAPFSPDGYRKWLENQRPDLSTGAPRNFGAGLAAAQADRNINVTTRLEPIQVQAPNNVTINVTGPGISGQGQLPLSATAPRGQTSATEVPGPAAK